ncbi:asparagine synthase-related protein [Paenibacillus sp. NPDC056579]|uniref:asparagine synthase-related protein n=1 Tax=Paenibacillus sp. NPDC056579 TaxID=3345871 RepID=UPI0036BB82C9
MSAITGIFQIDQEAIPIEHGRMLMSCLEKFPADRAGVWSSGCVFLGCHAQHITPESVHEVLPHYDSERRLAITADAIIDNRDALFQQLQVEHGRRSTLTDSELIILAYDKWGDEAPNHLIGDYAFMIWDERRHRLFGARDFSGSRTLYYYADHRRFAFCTVMEPILALPYTGRELNEQWLAQYLAITASVDTADVSITPYIGIEQLPPSHSIAIDGNGVSVKRYCRVVTGKRLKLKSDEEYVEAFRDVFQQAVTSRLRTYRGVASHLSGGLDSGSVVSFAANKLKAESKTLHTFSYIPTNDFQDYTPKYLMADERPYIRSIVQHIGGINDHYLDFEGKDSFSNIDSLLGVMEMPYKFFENSFWVQGMFEKGQQEDIGVMLSGARGNLSISWGSALDYYATLLKGMRWFRLVHELHHYSINAGGARLGRLPIVARVAFPVMDRIFPSTAPYRFPTLINRQFAKRTDVFNKLRDYGLDHTGWFSTTNLYKQRKLHYDDVFHWNATNTLVTKLSLRHALWQRDPTNDIRVIRFCLSVPEEQYVRNGVDRALIRRSTQNMLPDQVRLNQRIRGVQGADWLHRMVPYWDSFIGELQQLSTDSRMLEFVDGEVIKTALSKMRDKADPKLATDPDCRILMRSLILYRYLKKFA